MTTAALPSSGTISLSDIAAEFKKTTPPYSMSQFYKGGSFVPAGSAPEASNSSIPASGTLSIGNFHGSRWWRLVYVPSTTTSQVNQGYWTDPAPYQQFQETSRYFVGSGRWNVGNTTNPNLPMWPDGTPESYYGSSGDYSWVNIGDYDIGDGYTYWRFNAYATSGYYYTVDPSPYWTDNWVTVTVDNSYYAHYYD